MDLTESLLEIGNQETHNLYMWNQVIFSSILLVSLDCFAQNADEIWAEIGPKLMMLQNSSSRGAVLKASPGGEEANKKLLDVAGSKENVEALYEIAPLMAQEILQQAKGDPGEMLKIMGEVQKNPASFLNSLEEGSELKNKIRQIANDISNSRQSKNP